MKLFVYQNNWNLIIIAKIRMQELKKIRCKFMGKMIKLIISRVTYIDCYNLHGTTTSHTHMVHAWDRTFNTAKIVCIRGINTAD